MESYLTESHCDLVTPDGCIEEILSQGERSKIVSVRIEAISPTFVGYQIDSSLVFFNLKSTLAQLGLHSITLHIAYQPEKQTAFVRLELFSHGELGKTTLQFLQIGTAIGKLFAADERRRVRDPDYLMRMFNRSDREGRPLLSLGGYEGSGELTLEKIDGRTVAFLSLREGITTYESSIYGFLPTLMKALQQNFSGLRQLLHLHHERLDAAPRIVTENKILLVRTMPLHIRTVYARVVDSLLPPGYQHTSASVLQPDTFASGDIYELFGNSSQVIKDIPLEFYTLEPHREHVFFSDRDQLQSCLEDPIRLFEAFNTAPSPNHLASVFVVKGTQLQSLTEKDWIARDPHKYEFPGLSHPARQAQIVDKYIELQPAYPFLKAIENGTISSQGILLCRHFPSPLLKRMLLSDEVQLCLKRLYFQFPSHSHDGYFSHEDRAMLLDLAKFGIPTFWVDSDSKKNLTIRLKTGKRRRIIRPTPPR